MKKLVAVFIIIYFLGTGIMVVWGFIDKQIKEKAVIENANSKPESTKSSIDNNSSSIGDQSFSLDEVAKHKTAQNCWVAINGKVYNVTSYLDMHPGGSDLILMVCGTDASEAYRTQGGRNTSHSEVANRDLSKYEIGKLKN